MERSRIALHLCDRFPLPGGCGQRTPTPTWRGAWRMKSAKRLTAPLLIEADANHFGAEDRDTGRTRPWFSAWQSVQGPRWFRILEPVICENVTAGSLSTQMIFAPIFASQPQYLSITARPVTSTLEGFWSRELIHGTHIHVSRKHLWKYVKEFEYRYNRRRQPALIFSDLVASL